MEGLQKLKEYRPEVFQAMMNLKQTIHTKSSLDQKTLNLIIVSVQTTLGNPNAVKAHAMAAKKAGASNDEIIDAMLAILPAIGLPAILEVLPEVIKEIEQ